MQAAFNENLEKVLGAVVTSYISHGLPVGSRFVWVNFDVGLSPASIRNLMAELEEMGLLTKPHVSAGRIPTERGYRLYVDRVMKSYPLKPRETKAIRRAMDPSLPVEAMLERISQELEALSRQVCVTLTPVVWDEGAAGQATDNLDLSDHGPRSNVSGLGSTSIDLLSDLHYVIHVYGTGNVVGEIGDMADLRSLLVRLEKRREISKWLLLGRRRVGTSVSIGSENKGRSMRRWSIVKSRYKVGDAMGAVGVIGPLRMDYPRLLALVDYTSGELTRFLAQAGGR
jgi:heat-inducible transcriptional repressor